MDERATATTGTLRLSRDPFESAGEHFFGAGDRARRLLELRSPGRWSAPVAIVTGEEGTGKSAFFRALSSRLDAGIKAARITGDLVADRGSVLYAVLCGFGISIGADPDETQMAEAIAAHVGEQRDLGRSCLIMVDDAHRLEQSALGALLGLLEACGDDGTLRLILFAEPAFVQSLQRLYRRRNRVPRWHETRLSPLAPDEISDYLAFRMAEAGWDGALPFSDAEIRSMMRRTGGVPGKVEALASAWLRERLQPRLHRAAVPPLHRALAAVIGAFLVAAWLLWPTQESAEPERRALELPALDLEERRMAQETARIERAETARADLEAVPFDAEEAEEEAPVDSAEEEALVEAEETAPVDLVDEVLTRSAAAPAQVGSGESQPDEPRGRSWVMSRPAQHYTLQLLAASDGSRVAEYLERQSEPPRFASVELRRDGRLWHVVIFGDYADRAAAEAASRELPESVGAVEPWIRSFASLQRELEHR